MRSHAAARRWHHSSTAGSTSACTASGLPALDLIRQNDRTIIRHAIVRREILRGLANPRLRHRYRRGRGRDCSRHRGAVYAGYIRTVQERVGAHHDHRGCEQPSRFSTQQVSVRSKWNSTPRPYYLSLCWCCSCPSQWGEDNNSPVGAPASMVHWNPPRRKTAIETSKRLQTPRRSRSNLTSATTKSNTSRFATLE